MSNESNNHIQTRLTATHSGKGGRIGMKKRILLTFAIAVASLWMGYGFDAPAPASEGGPGSVAVGNAGGARTPPPGRVREVTAYNVGVKEQTNDQPCLGATGENLCRLVARGLKVCAANFVAPKTILHIEGYGECVVLDRMNRRFAHRVDIAMRGDEADKAREFGVQRRHVKVKPVEP
jgi:3D (Asp-Asp-Asp) domain-containing protein